MNLKKMREEFGGECRCCWKPSFVLVGVPLTAGVYGFLECCIECMTENLDALVVQPPLGET